MSILDKLLSVKTSKLNSDEVADVIINHINDPNVEFNSCKVNMSGFTRIRTQQHEFQLEELYIQVSKVTTSDPDGVLFITYLCYITNYKIISLIYVSHYLNKNHTGIRTFEYKDGILDMLNNNNYNNGYHVCLNYGMCVYDYVPMFADFMPRTTKSSRNS